MMATDRRGYNFTRLLSELSDEHDIVPGDEDIPIVVVDPAVDDPVVTSPIMSHQPTELDKLPIHEDDYTPQHADELSRATRLLFKELPDEVSGWMWKKVKLLASKVHEHMNNNDSMTERKIRRLVRSVLNEADDDKRGKRRRNPYGRSYNQGVYDDEAEADRFARAADIIGQDVDTDLSDMDLIPGGVPMATMALSDDDADLLRSLQAQADEDEIDADDRIEDEQKEKTSRRKNVTAGEEGMSLSDIAKKMGYSGASGVKNLLYKIEDQVQYFASLDEVWFKKLMIEFAKAYVEELKDAVGENLSPADVMFLDDLMEDPESVLDIPEFRMWATDYLKTIHKKKLGKKAK